MIWAEGLEVWRASPGRGPIHALRGVSLELGAGQVGVVLGRSGSGKTTLLEALGGLLALSAGAVGVALGAGPGRRRWEAREAAPPELPARIGFLFQHPERQLFGANALEDVSWGLGPAGGAAACRALERVELSRTLWEAPLARLSRGEKRRVALAGVLVRRPAVLLLDEPAVGLDPAGQALLLGEIDAYRQESQAAVLVATHWPESLLERADLVLCLADGMPRYVGSVGGLGDAAREDARVAELLPFASRLRQALEKRTPPWAR